MTARAAHLPRRGGPGLRALRIGLGAVALTAGTLALLFPGPAVAPPVEAPPPAPVVRAVAVPPATTTVPVSVAVPSVDLTSSLVPIGVDGSGALVPPADYGQAGWFAGGPVPGQVGPAVLAGHVDSRSGPAVFSRLVDVAVGAQVLVGRDDGSTVVFGVTRVAGYPKTGFGTTEVYGPTVDPQLRLITCGGEFDRSRRSYTRNAVVFARAVGA